MFAGDDDADELAEAEREAAADEHAEEVARARAEEEMIEAEREAAIADYEEEVAMAMAEEEMAEAAHEAEIAEAEEAAAEAEHDDAGPAVWRSVGPVKCGACSKIFDTAMEGREFKTADDWFVPDQLGVGTPCHLCDDCVDEAKGSMTDTERELFDVDD